MKTKVGKSLIAVSMVVGLGMIACNNKGDKTGNDTEIYETTIEDNSENPSNMGSADSLARDTTFSTTPDKTMTDTSINLR